MMVGGNKYRSTLYLLSLNLLFYATNTIVVDLFTESMNKTFNDDFDVRRYTGTRPIKLTVFY